MVAVGGSESDSPHAEDPEEAQFVVSDPGGEGRA